MIAGTATAVAGVVGTADHVPIVIEPEIDPPEHVPDVHLANPRRVLMMVKAGEATDSTINAIAPGFMETDMTKTLDGDRFHRHFRQQPARGRRRRRVREPPCA